MMRGDGGGEGRKVLVARAKGGEGISEVRSVLALCVSERRCVKYWPK